MKKLSLISLLILLVFTACEDIPNGVIDSTDPNYRLLAINAPSEFFYSPSDSVFTTSAKFENTSTIARVWFNIVTDDGTASIKQNVPMLDDGSSESGDITAGDGMFTGKTILGGNIASGKYIVEYYVENNVSAGTDRIQLVSSHSLKFTSSKDNSAPVISELSAPDTVVVQDPKSLIQLRLKAEDENGLVDIKSVNFVVIAPNSSSSTPIAMLDDGKEENGDETAGDGIFSRIIEVTPSNTKGDYTFEFVAEDRAGALSNKIIHIITIK